MTRKAAFLDRDGTLNVKAPEHEYVTSEHAFIWLPGAREGLARLAKAGYVLAVASNQRGVTRGLVTPGVLSAIEARIQRDLASYGCSIEAFRYCTHNDEANCDCRKPKPGLVLDLARELGVDLDGSWMIGDSESDVQVGAATGCSTALIGAGRVDTAADIVAASLAEASELIVLQRRSAVA